MYTMSIEAETFTIKIIKIDDKNTNNNEKSNIMVYNNYVALKLNETKCSVYFTLTSRYFEIKASLEAIAFNDYNLELAEYLPSVLEASYHKLLHSDLKYSIP